MKKIKIFSGNSNLPLAKQICGNMGLPLNGSLVTGFSDGETQVSLSENVRGCDVFLIQSTSTPANNNLMELLLLADAAKRSSARRVIAVIPYFGYARQDRRPRTERSPISAKVVASCLESAGVDHIINVDLHSHQTQGFFNIPVDIIYASSIFIKTAIHNQIPNLENIVVVSPDTGGTTRARKIAKDVGIETDIAIIDKRRPGPNVAEIMNIIGDIEDKDCIVVDDMLDTGGTLVKGAKALRDNGAKSVIAFCTHGVLSGKALSLFSDNNGHNAIDKLYITNSILNKKLPQRIHTLDISKLLAQAITCVYKNKSMTDFVDLR